VLASWFRLKYPHIVIGALASSAPILYFDDITPQNGYLSVVTKDYQVSISKMNLLNSLNCPIRTRCCPFILVEGSKPELLPDHQGIMV